MEESMYQRLEIAVKRLAEIDEELSSEDVTRDIAHFRELSKERANLDPQVEAFNRFKKVTPEKIICMYASIPFIYPGLLVFP